jgi:molybdopterin-guanine dinucleotide biosynthesis protein A
MPFLNPALLAHLAARANARDGAIPRGPDGLHPLHAVYAKRCAEALGRAVEGGRLKLTDAIAGLDLAEIGAEELRRFDPGLHSLFNVNRPEDLQRARAILAGVGATEARAGERD